MLNEVAPNLVTLGYFNPPWLEYKSYDQEREVHWNCFLNEHLQRIAYHQRLPFQLGDFKAHDVRTAEWHRIEFNNAMQKHDVVDIQQWHKDYSATTANVPGTYEHEVWMIVWANVRPTEIQMPDGSVFAGEPFQLVAFQNGRYKHRTPALSYEEANRRWFARAYMNPWTPNGMRIVKNGLGDRVIIPRTLRPADVFAESQIPFEPDQ